MKFTILFGFTYILHGVRTDCDDPSITRVSGTQIPTQKICPGDLIFEDSFDTKLNLQKWHHEITLGGRGNWEFEWYTNNRSNSYVETGVLHIRPTLVADEFGNNFLYSGKLDLDSGAPADKCTNPKFWGCSRTGTKSNILNPIKSASLTTLDTFHFLYGKVEIRAKLPAGDWLWPAIRMLPRWNDYSSWPASGEIDIMESRGNKHYVNTEDVNVGSQQVRSALQWGPNYLNNKHDLTNFRKNNPAGYDTDFHIYQLEWNVDYIKFSVDYETIGYVVPSEGGFWQIGHFEDSGLSNPWKSGTKMAPFDQEFYIVLGLSVGGTAYFPDEFKNHGGKPWRNKSPRASTDFWEGRDKWLPSWNLAGSTSEFQIDYVRVWAI